MYQMMMGRPPFMAEQSIDVIVKHMKEAPASFNAVRPDLEIPPEVEAVVFKCLEKDPARRYQSMDELLEGMRRATSSVGMSGLFSGPRFNGSIPPPTPPPMLQPGQSGPMSKLPPGQTGPRNKMGSGPHVMGSTGPHVKSPTGPHVRPPTGPHSRPPSGAFSQGAVAAAQDGSQPMSPATRGRSKAVPVVLFIGSVALGLTIMWALSRGEAPLPRDKPPVVNGQPAPVTPPQPPLAAVSRPPAKVSSPVALAPLTGASEVRFRIESEPPGAQVMVDGKEGGSTPVEFTRPPGQDGTASVAVVLAKDGYETMATTAAGSGDVVVSQKLRRKASPPPPTPPRKDPGKKPPTTSGYKDDPYQ
jgi:serine/threonine-protein kinase